MSYLLTISLFVVIVALVVTILILNSYANAQKAKIDSLTRIVMLTDEQNDKLKTEIVLLRVKLKNAKSEP